MKYIKFVFIITFLMYLTGCIQNPTPSDKTYTITFDTTSSVEIENQEVLENSKIIKPSDPKLDGYTFLGWYYNEELWNFDDVVTKDMNLVAKWDENKPTSAVVNLVTKSGEILRTFDASVGEVIPLYRVNKVAKGYEIIGYSCNGLPWDLEKDVVLGDMDLVMDLKVITYQIKYYDDGELLEGLTPAEYTVESSASIDLPDAPVKAGYEFIGWFDGTTRIVTFFSSDAEDKTFTAKYQKIKTAEDLLIKLPTEMSHEFTNVKKVALSDGKGYVYQPDFTGLGLPTSVQQYTWTSLNPDIVTISMWSSMSVVAPGYAVIKAVSINDPSIVICCVVKATNDGITISSEEEANTIVEYNVVFKDDLGNVIDEQKVRQNKNALLPTPPKKAGYTFIGWDTDHVNITQDTTITATYMAGDSDFIGKTVSILGDSISTFKNYIPSGYAAFYPYPTADVFDVNYTWWMRVINNLGMKLLKNNSYSGSCVSAGTGASGTTNDSRLVELTKGTERPDIILIFMGANDCGSSNVSLQTFTSSYKVMLDKIQTICPESEIYLITLPASGLYTEDNRIKYNEVIESYAQSYNLPLIDLADLYTTTTYKEYVVDSAHPNNAGMIRIADKIIDELLKNIK